MGSLLVVTGPPGAGKSTLSAKLATRYDTSVLVRGDDVFGFLASGAIEPWRPESAAQNEVVIEAAARATGRFAEAYDTVYDGVVGPWFLPAFATATGLAALDYVVILPPVEICVVRMSARVGHGFSDEAAARKMHAEFAQAVIDSRHVLELPGQDPGSCVEAILAARAAGRLRYALPQPEL